MDKPHFAVINPTEPDNPVPAPQPNCPTCFSGVAPTIRELEFEKALKEGL